MSMQQLAEAQTNAEIPVNRNFQSLEHQSVYGQRQSAHSGLTYGYYGGRWGGFSVADGALTLTNAADNYVVVLRSSGAISTSTSTTNWNDSGSYARVYKLTTAGSVVTVTEDHRAGPGGVHGNATSAATLSVQTVTSSATVTPLVTNDLVEVTAQAAAVDFAAPSGSPTNGWGLVIRFKDDGTTRAITWNAIYRAIGVTLPSTTVATKQHYVASIYNSASTTWDVVAVGVQA